VSQHVPKQLTSCVTQQKVALIALSIPCCVDVSKDYEQTSWGEIIVTHSRNGRVVCLFVF